MLPAVDRKLYATNKEKSHRKTKDKKHKHKLKSKSSKQNYEPERSAVQYSDVSSEELSSPEAGEIHSDYEDKYCRLSFKSKKIITDNLLITTRVSPRQESPCSPLNDQWNKTVTQDNYLMSTNTSLNNCVDVTSEVVKHQKSKKNKKSNKKRKSPGTKKKKKKKEIKRVTLLDTNNSNVKASKYTNLELLKRNGEFSESVKKQTNIDEESHTPPLIKTSSKVFKTEEDKFSKHLKKEDKR